MEPGLLLAYVAMGVMAVLPIYYGSFASLKGMKAKKLPAKKEKGYAYATSSSEEEEAEALTKEDAYWFPIMGSCVLFGLYLVFKFVSKEYINYLLTAYFGLLGVAALTKMTTSIIKSVTGIRLHSFKVVMTKRAKVLFQLRFTYLHITMAIFSAIMSGYYVYTKNWIASNLFGLAFSVNAVQLLALDSFQTGTILLAGLFIYDIFWVFGTEVMVTVAKNFDAPVKVVWPKNLFADEPKFTMLGLGDIVIPGIFVALCLRFDHHIALARLRSKMPAGVIKTYKFPRPYFNSCFVAYILGLVTTVTVMHTFQAAQPALLYLSPACILASCGTALFRGEFKEFWAYTSEKADEDDKVKEVKSKGKSTSVQGTDAKKSAIQQRNVSVESSNDEASAAESPSLSKKGKSKSKSRSK